MAGRYWFVAMVGSILFLPVTFTISAELEQQYLGVEADGGACSWLFSHNKGRMAAKRKDARTDNWLTATYITDGANPEPALPSTTTDAIDFYEVETQSNGSVFLESATTTLRKGVLSLVSVECVSPEQPVDPIDPIDPLDALSCLCWGGFTGQDLVDDFSSMGEITENPYNKVCYASDNLSVIEVLSDAGQLAAKMDVGYHLDGGNSAYYCRLSQGFDSDLTLSPIAEDQWLTCKSELDGLMAHIDFCSVPGG